MCIHPDGVGVRGCRVAAAISSIIFKTAAYTQLSHAADNRIVQAMLPTRYICSGVKEILRRLIFRSFNLIFFLTKLTQPNPIELF